MVQHAPCQSVCFKHLLLGRSGGHKERAAARCITARPVLRCVHARLRTGLSETVACAAGRRAGPGALVRDAVQQPAAAARLAGALGGGRAAVRELRLPPPNPFVPTDFALLPASARSGAALSPPCPTQNRAVSGMAHAEEVALLFLTGCLCHAGRPQCGVHASLSTTLLNACIHDHQGDVCASAGQQGGRAAAACGAPDARPAAVAQAGRGHLRAARRGRLPRVPLPRGRRPAPHRPPAARPGAPHAPGGPVELRLVTTFARQPADALRAGRS